MTSRLRTSPRHPVQFWFDDTPLLAERGDTLALALWANGIRSLVRSPKYRRPRGPFCFQGHCEGCLLRVDGTPNTMACQVRVEEGLRARSQNLIGPPSFDPLRAADFVFPHGMNHHELLAGVPVLEDLLQLAARQISGLGTLPDQVKLPSQGRERAVEVLILGGGRAGQALHRALRASGRDVVSLDPTSAEAEIERALAFGIFGPAERREVLAVSDQGVTRFSAQALVLCTGSYDVLPMFENNDLPGIVSLRAAEALHEREVKVGTAPLVLSLPGGAPERAVRFAAASGARHLHGVALGARGLSEVQSVEVEIDGSRAVLEADALVLDAPRAPAHELAVQAGANTVAADAGFQVQVDAAGRAGPGLWAAGSLTGSSRPLEELARAIADSLPAR